VQQGQSARLFVGDRQFYQFLQDGYNLTLTSTEAGVSLLVSAGAITEDAISAYVALDVSTFRGSRRPPIVDTREASANVILSNGGTLIVGGGIVESARFRDRDSLYGIPGRKRDSGRCSEIVFLVGAEIITDESDAATRLPFGREI
jgi:Flp pilus assembly secretin CpaC